MAKRTGPPTTNSTSHTYVTHSHTHTLWHDSNHQNINVNSQRIVSMSNPDGANDAKATNSGYFVRARPKSVYSARVLVFEDSDEPHANKSTTGATRKSSPEQNTKQLEQQPNTSSSVYRKTAYQTQHSHSLRSNSGLDNISNMVRVRNSTLGKSAPSLSASMVSVQ